jgi:hypothetical protein
VTDFAVPHLPENPMLLSLRLTQQESELVERALRDQIELLASEGRHEECFEIAAIVEKIELARSGS